MKMGRVGTLKNLCLCSAGYSLLSRTMAAANMALACNRTNPVKPWHVIFGPMCWQGACPRIGRSQSNIYIHEHVARCRGSARSSTLSSIKPIVRNIYVSSAGPLHWPVGLRPLCLHRWIEAWAEKTYEACTIDAPDQGVAWRIC